MFGFLKTELERKAGDVLRYFAPTHIQEHGIAPLQCNTTRLTSDLGLSEGIIKQFVDKKALTISGDTATFNVSVVENIAGGKSIRTYRGNQRGA